MGYYLTFALNVKQEKIPENVVIAKKLLMEVVGYLEKDAEKLVFIRPDKTILVNLTIEEAIKIAQPFEDHDMIPGLYNHATNAMEAWNDYHFFVKQPIKDHYECLARPECRINPDQKYITQEPYVPTPKPQPSKPSVECPYCHSTNCKKISGVSKAGSVALFGLFSQKARHQWHCNDCKSDF